MRAAGEALLEPLPDRPAIERQPLGQYPNRLVHGANRVAGYTRINDLRHRTARSYARVLAVLVQGTGVPQVITSIIGPNGSGQSMGNTASSVSATCRWLQSPMPSASRIANANFVAPVHHGIPVHLLKPNCNRGEYVAFRASLRRSGPTGPFESSDPGRRRFTSSRAVAARTATARLSQVRASRARAGRVADQIDPNQISTPWCRVNLLHGRS